MGLQGRGRWLTILDGHWVGILALDAGWTLWMDESWISKLSASRSKDFSIYFKGFRTGRKLDENWTKTGRNWMDAPPPNSPLIKWLFPALTRR